MWPNSILNYLEAADEFQPLSLPRRITFCITDDLECLHVFTFFLLYIFFHGLRTGIEL